jgi:hypothetical protein
MSYLDEVSQDLIQAKLNNDIEEVERLSALYERGRIFQNLIYLIQQKDSFNDLVAAEVLSWAWKELSDK